MSYCILDTRSLEIERVDQGSGRLSLAFAQARIEKIMDNAEQRTLWTQAGALEIWAAQVAPALPEAPFVIAHSDLDDGSYTQRDMIRIPLDVSGTVAVALQCAELPEPCRIEGARARLRLDGNPRYVRHLDPES